MAMRRLRWIMERILPMLFRQSLPLSLCLLNSSRGYTWHQWLVNNLNLQDKWEIQHHCELQTTIPKCLACFSPWNEILGHLGALLLPRRLFHVVWWRGGVPVVMELRSCKLMYLNLNYITWMADNKSGPIIFLGGLLLLITSILEFILGNTFPCVVFGTIGEESINT